MDGLENKSGNLKEILCAIADGKKVQYGGGSSEFLDYDINSNFNPLNRLQYKWRVKPNPFEEAFDAWIVNNGATGREELAFIAGWNAAIDHQNKQGK